MVVRILLFVYNLDMKFEDFLKKVAPKVGPNSAFSLARDARIQALEDLIVEKNIVTKDQLQALQDAQLEKLANDIVRMPPIPKK